MELASDFSSPGENLYDSNNFGNYELIPNDKDNMLLQDKPKSGPHALSLLKNNSKDFKKSKFLIEKELKIGKAFERYNLKLLTVSCNEEHLASVSNNSTLSIWNLDLQLLIYEISLNSQYVTSIAFSRDNKRIWIVSKSCNIEYLDIQLQRIFSFYSAKPNKINHLIVFLDDNYIWFSTIQRQYFFIDSNREIANQKNLNSAIVCAVASKKQNILYFGTLSGQLFIIKASEGFENKIINIYQGPLGCLALDPDENQIYVGDFYGKIAIIELSSFSINIVMNNRSRVTSMVVSKHNNLFFTSQSIYISLQHFDSNFKSSFAKERIYTNWIYPLILLPLKNQILYVNSQNLIQSLNIGNFESNSLLILNPLTITCFVISANNEHLVTGCDDGTIRVWDLRKKVEKFIITEISAVTNLLFITFNKKYLIAATIQNNIATLNSSTYIKYQQFSAHKYKITSITCDFLSRFIITCSKDYTIKFWNLKTSRFYRSSKVTDYSIKGFAIKNKKYHIDIFKCSKQYRFRVWRFII